MRASRFSPPMVVAMNRADLPRLRLAETANAVCAVRWGGAGAVVATALRAKVEPPSRAKPSPPCRWPMVTT